MQKSGEDCKPTTIKFLALTNYDGGSQWSIGCQTSNPNNKGGLWVNLKPNGDTKIMECKYLEQMGGSCQLDEIHPPHPITLIAFGIC